MTGTKKINHPDSAKQKLLAEINWLCERLARPVCSQDLRQHFHENPDRRPVLLQRYGQLLIKCSRPFVHSVGRIYVVGVHQGRAYYAVDESQKWRDKFRQLVLREQIKWAASSSVPIWGEYLLSTEHERLARYALAGWQTEARQWLEELNDPADPGAICLEGGLKEAALPDGGPFIPNQEQVLLDRLTVKMLIRKECARRIGLESVERLSLQRHFAALSWPQSGFFPARARGKYFLREQVEAYIRWRWPLDEDNPILSQARVMCLRYGLPAPLPSPS